MAEFDDFLDTATTVGVGRVSGRIRDIPAFVADGQHQQRLLVASLTYLLEHGFHAFDVRNGNYEEAVAKFSLEWPHLSEKSPSEEYSFRSTDSAKRIVIVCGKHPHPHFWRNLCDESLLFTGGALPPTRGLSPMCIVVPDTACVVALIASDDLDAGYQLQYFGAVGRYSTNTVPFQI